MNHPNKLDKCLPKEWYDLGEELLEKQLQMDLEDLTKLVVVDWLPQEAIRSVYHLFNGLPRKPKKSQERLAAELGTSIATWNRYKKSMMEDRLDPLDKSRTGNLLMAMIIHLALSNDRPTLAEIVFRTLSVIIRRIQHELIDKEETPIEPIEFEQTKFTRLQCGALHYYLRLPGSFEIDLEKFEKLREVNSFILAPITRELKKDFPKAKIQGNEVLGGILEYCDAYLIFRMAVNEAKWDFFQ